jgi:hypothetical protein
MCSIGLSARYVELNMMRAGIHGINNAENRYAHLGNQQASGNLSKAGTSAL